MMKEILFAADTFRECNQFLNDLANDNSRLQIQVKDEKTGVLIVMEKHVPDIQF